MISRLKTILWASCFCLAIPLAHTQEEPSLLDLLGEEETTEKVTNAFKSTRVVNGQSLEMLGAGVLDFRILHRFGKFSLGAYQMFGLDNASMRLSFDYGIIPNLMVGLGRSTNKKEVDGFVKYRILWQSTGKKTMPVSLLWVSGITVNGLKDPVGFPEVKPLFRRRLGYYHQFIVGRKFSERFSLQLSPTLVHSNIVQNRLIPNDLFAVGLGGRYKLTNRIALVLDYYYVINGFANNPVKDPLTIGLDIETGGHVFQLHLSNAVGMNEHAFLTDDNGSWLKGDIQFGFNLSRVFQISKPSFQ